MTALPPAGTRISNPFSGETFIFTHVDEEADCVQFDVFLEPWGLQSGTGR